MQVFQASAKKIADSTFQPFLQEAATLQAALSQGGRAEEEHSHAQHTSVQWEHSKAHNKNTLFRLHYSPTTARGRHIILVALEWISPLFLKL